MKYKMALSMNKKVVEETQNLNNCMRDTEY